MDKIRVLLVSEQSLLRQGIEHLLSGIEDIDISGIAGVNNGVLPCIDALPPDVAVLDTDGSFENSLKLASRIKQHSPYIGIIMLTSNPSDEQLFQALKFHAADYLDKKAETKELVDRIRRVARGEHPINESLATRPKVAERVLSQFQRLSWQSEAEEYMSPLSPRETEILDYVAQGYLNKQIAIKLGISEQTIKNHVTSILRKLNVNVRTEAVVLAIKKGLIYIS